MNWKLVLSHFAVAVIALMAWLLLLEQPTNSQPHRNHTPANVSEAEPRGLVHSLLGMQDVKTADETQSVQFEQTSTEPSIFDIQLNAYRDAQSKEPDQLVALIDEHIRSSDPLYFHSISMIYLERLIAIDPQLAINFAEEFKGNMQQKHVLFSSILTSWARYEPSAALQYLSTMSNQNLKMNIASRLSRDPLFTDSEDVSRLAQIMGVRGKHMLAAMHRRNKSSAQQFEDAMQTTGMMRHSRGNAFANWWREDPEAAIARLANLDQSDVHSIFQTAIDMIAREDPRAALQLARTYAPDNVQLEGQALAILAGQDPDNAWAELEAHIERTGNHHLLQQAIQSLAEQDLQRALELTSTLDGRTKTQAMSSLAMTYIGTDPDAAMAWLIDEGDNQALSIGLGFLANVDPDMAETYFDKTDDERVIAQLLQTIAGQRAQSGFQNTINWLEAHKDKPGYDAAVSQAIIASSHNNPDSAAAYLAEHIENENLNNAFMSFTSMWAHRNTSAAAEWALSLPDGTNRENAIVSVARASIMNQPDQALELLAELPKAQARQVIVQLAMMEVQRGKPLEDITAELDLTDEEVQAVKQVQNQPPFSVGYGISSG